MNFFPYFSDNFLEVLFIYNPQINQIDPRLILMD